MENYLLTALITLASGFISSYITIKLGLHRDLVTTKRERIEKYAMSLVSIDYMVEKLKERYLFSKDEIEIDEAALGTVEMLTKLYFEDIKDEFNSFNLAINTYKSYLYQTQYQLLVAQQASSTPLIKSIPTQKMIDSVTNQALIIYGERNKLLDTLTNRYGALIKKGVL